MMTAVQTLRIKTISKSIISQSHYKIFSVNFVREVSNFIDCSDSISSRLEFKYKAIYHAV